MNCKITGAAAAALMLLLFSVSAVAAHAELEESDPADGATIEAPYTLTATFSEEFAADPEISFMRVQDASGAVVASGGQSADDPTMMTVDLPELEPGEYTVRWQTTTEDDNGTERGTFTFKVAAAATPSPAATATPAASAPAASPTAAPTPTATPGGAGQSTAGGSDVLIALIIGLVIIGAIAAFLFARQRR